MDRDLAEHLAIRQSLTLMASALRKIEETESDLAVRAKQHGAMEALGILEACSGHAKSLRELLQAFAPAIMASFEEASRPGA